MADEGERDIPIMLKQCQLRESSAIQDAILLRRSAGRAHRGRSNNGICKAWSHRFGSVSDLSRLHELWRPRCRRKIHNAMIDRRPDFIK
jgi:hypothetical protein